MLGKDAQEILDAGGSVRRVDWPDFLILNPGDTIPPDDAGFSDWVEISEQELAAIQAEANGTLPQTQNIQQPETFAEPIAAPMPQATPTQPSEGKSMPVLNVKKTKPLDIKGFFDGAAAEVVAVLSAKCSDPTAALPILGDENKVIGLKPATGLTIECEAVVKDKDGLGYEVSAVSNTFDVVAVQSAELVAALNADGSPIFETTDDGTTVLDENTGQPKPLMIPGEAALMIKVNA